MMRPPARTHVALVGALVAAAGLARGARAAPVAAPDLEHLVILLKPPDQDALTTEALARITGELAAARFRVVIFPLDPSIDPIEQVDIVGGALAPVAAFALVRAPGGYGGTVDLWISDRLARRTTIQRMQVQGGDVSRAARLLAVESVELIRISLADLWPRPQPRVQTAPPPPALAEPPSRGRVNLSLGVGMAEDFGASVRFWAPVVRGGYDWPGGLGLFVAVRGLGSQADLSAPSGSASVRRDAAWLGLAETFRPGSRLQPFLSVGLGAERVRADGSTTTPAPVHAETSWSALGMVGAGLAAGLVPHLAVVLDVEGMLLVPPVVVRIGDADAARFDRPALLVEAGLRASF